MNGKFIIVFDKATADAMMSVGFNFLGQSNGQYMFLNDKNVAHFASENNIKALYTDILKF